MTVNLEALLVLSLMVMLASLASTSVTQSFVGDSDGVNLTLGSPFFTVNKKVYSLDDKSLKYVG